MDLPSTAVIELLTFLLPGFVAAAVYYTLTPSPRPAPFERIVQALILTMVVQTLVFCMGAALAGLSSSVAVWGHWTPDVQVAWSVGTAVLVGMTLAWAANRDRLHGLLRRMGITDQTSYASEWYGALCQNTGYMVLHLTGERRLYGWAEEWPSTPDRGHFVVAHAEWLHEGESIPLTGVHRIVIPAGAVEMVELMSATETASGGNHGRPQSADAATLITGWGQTRLSTVRPPSSD